MSSDFAIRLHDVTKHYLMFERPEDRLKQMIVPRVQRLAHREPKRYYRDFAAVNGISFEIKRGETVGIVGRNGCGKSTLLQIICGTLQPSSGTVEVNGRIAALLELGAGFNPEFTGRENVFMNAAILGLSQAETEARFDDIARFADIGLFIDQPVKTYSSGMYVRLAFAVATNVDPEILVVDEALSVGDEAFQRKCFARIEDIKDKGGTILFVSHSAQTIVQLCDRAILIDRGEKILEGRPKTVVSQYQRLVNASAEVAEEIRSSIIAVGDAPLEPAIASNVAARTPEMAEKGPAVAADGLAVATASPLSASAVAPLGVDDGLSEILDPNLKSQSVVELESRGARIRDVRITTLDGNPINVLRMSRRYVCQFTVAFQVSARDVGFGIWFRTIAGFGLGGAQTAFSRIYRTPHVQAQHCANVSYEFSSCLLPGTYFLSCGLFGTPAQHDCQIVMHRLIDVLPFRVAAEEHLLSTGIVDFSPAVSVLLHSDNEGTP